MIKAFSARSHVLDEALLAGDSWTRSKPPLNVKRESAEEAVIEGSLLEEGARPHCAAPGCSHQLRFWKRSARPVFEGGWACSPTCLSRMVQSSLRRQMAGVAAAAGALGSHRHRIPLGLVLLDRGIVTQSQLRQALDAQKAAGYGRIGHWLEQTCGMEPAKITRAMAAQWNRPVLSTNGFRANSMAAVMPEALRKDLRILPLRLAAGKILYAAFVDEVDVTAVSALERMSGLAVESGLLPHDEFSAAEAALSFLSPTEYREEKISDITELSERIVDTLFDEQPVASRLVSVRGGWWLRLWLERAACGDHGTLPSTGQDVHDVLFRR